MNWTHIFRMFEPTRDGRSASSSGFLHALKTLFPAQSGSRRPKSEGCGHAERLEVRQVLSVANLAVVMNPAAVSEVEPHESSFDVPTLQQLAAVDGVGEADPAAVEQEGSELLQNDSGDSDWNWKPAGLSAADRSSFPGVSTSENLLNSSVTVPTTPSKIIVNTSAPHDLQTSSIDELFHDSGKILDSSWPLSTIDESVASASIVRLVPEGLTPSPNNPIPVTAAPVVQNVARNLPVTVPGFVIPVAAKSAPVSVNAAWPQSNGWNWRTTSPSGFVARPQTTANGTSKQTLTVSVAFARCICSRSNVSVNGDADYKRLVGLTVLNWFSTGYEPSTSRISSSPVAADPLPVAVPLVNSGVDQQTSPQTFTFTAQTKVKSFREGHRQNFTSTKLIEVSHEHDSLPDLIDSKDVPRALKYVVLPRGPPRKQPDTVLRIMDSDAAAHVLQRLRYSIAPRGPSTVTVELQSPEKRSFSGPRVSPEERLSVQLAC